MTGAYSRWGRPVVIPVDENNVPLGTAANPVAVSDQTAPVTLTDRSGTLSNQAKEAAPANPSRKALLIANPDGMATLFVNLTGTAAAGAGSIRLAPGAPPLIFDRIVPTGAVSVFGTGINQPYTVKEA